MYLKNSKALGEKIEERFEVEQDKKSMSREKHISAYNYIIGELGHLSHNAEVWAKNDGLGKK